MDSERVLKLVLQYLAETYPRALSALESESNVKYVDDEMALGSELVTILNDYHDLSLATKLTNEDADNRELDQDIMTVGSGDYVKKIGFTLEPSVHSQASILSLRFNDRDDKVIFASGGTDKTVRIFDYETRQLLWETQPHMAGVISLDFNPLHPHLLLTGSMDSNHTIQNLKTKSEIQRFKDHKKFVVRTRWSPKGNSFATAGYDRSVCIYTCSSSDDLASDQQPTFTLTKRIEFQGNVEALDYSPDGSRLIASIRDDNYLNYIDTETFAINRVNMNANGDDHVSFTALDIAVSPSGNHLLVATDKDRLILYRMETEIQLRNFYGASNDGLSQPRVCWHPSGKYIYATSQDKSIYVWDVVTQKVVQKLSGHTAIPRTMDVSSQKGYLLTGGFDKTVKSWVEE